LDFPVEESEFHLKIVGCGLGSRVFMDRPLRFRNVKAVTLHEVALEPHFLAKGDMGAIALDRCAEVRLTGCHLSGVTDGDEKNAKGVLLSITNADRILLRDNVIEAAVINSLKQYSQTFKEAKVDFLEKLFGLPEKGIFNFEPFRLEAMGSARQLAKLNADQRQQILEKLKVPSGDGMISSGEKFAFGKFRTALKAKEPQAEVFYDSLINIRRAAIKTRPGAALVLSTALQEETTPGAEIVGRDDDYFATLESNNLLGILSLYGMPAPADFIPEVFQEEIIKQLRDDMKEKQIKLAGRLGTLHMRGNQLVQITVARDTIEKIQKLLSDSSDLGLNLFGRCLMSDNVIEGGVSPLVTEHLAMTANEFTTMALPVISVETSGVIPPLAIVVAGSSIYLGNHCRREDGILRNISRAHSEAANLEINFT
jgi:hypothetical protein